MGHKAENIFYMVLDRKRLEISDLDYVSNFHVGGEMERIRVQIPSFLQQLLAMWPWASHRPPLHLFSPSLQYFGGD